MKQLRIGSLAHHHASLRDNILRLEYQHPSPSLTPSHPDSLFSTQRLPSKNSAPSIRQALPYETFPPPPPPTLTISYRRVVLVVSSPFRWFLFRFSVDPLSSLVPPRTSAFSTNSWAAFASARARDYLKSLYIDAVDDR